MRNTYFFLTPISCLNFITCLSYSVSFFFFFSLTIIVVFAFPDSPGSLRHPVSFEIHFYLPRTWLLSYLYCIVLPTPRFLSTPRWCWIWETILFFFAQCYSLPDSFSFARSFPSDCLPSYYISLLTFVLFFTLFLLISYERSYHSPSVSFIFLSPISSPFLYRSLSLSNSFFYISFLFISNPFTVASLYLFIIYLLNLIHDNNFELTCFIRLQFFFFFISLSFITLNYSFLYFSNDIYYIFFDAEYHQD